MRGAVSDAASVLLTGLGSLPSTEDPEFWSPSHLVASRSWFSGRDKSDSRRKGPRPTTDSLAKEECGTRERR